MQFYTKLAGVTHDGRQGIIRNLHRVGELDTGTELVLKREPNNPYDSFAVAVLTKDGQSIGYIPKDTARQISINMNSGMTYRAYVSDVTGGDAGYAYGVNLRIEYEENQTSNCKTNLDYNFQNKGDGNMFSQQIYNTFKEALNNVNFRYEEKAEKGMILIPNLGLDSTIKSVSILIEVRDTDCIISGMYDNFKIPSNNMANVSELLMRINNIFYFPQLVLNYDENTIFCKQHYDFVGELINVQRAIDVFGNLGLHMQRCGNSIMAVSLGLQLPKDAVESIIKE